MAACCCGSGMAKPLNLAFYGCGLIAEHHMVAVTRCRNEGGVDVRVVACVDIDLARATTLCSLSNNPGELSANLILQWSKGSTHDGLESVNWPVVVMCVHVSVCLCVLW